MLLIPTRSAIRCKALYPRTLVSRSPTMAMDKKHADDEKNNSLHIDDIESGEHDLKSSNAAEGDYAGAVAKSDPKEIALVRKLDFRIMPALFCMYFL